MEDDLESLQRSLDIRQKMVEEFPNVVKYREFVGLSLTSLGHWYARNDELEKAIDFHSRALVVREELVEVMPKPMYVEHLSETHVNLAELRGQQEDWESAKDHLSRAIEMNPDNPSFYVARAEYHRKTENSEAALVDLSRV